MRRIKAFVKKYWILLGIAVLAVIAFVIRKTKPELIPYWPVPSKTGTPDSSAPEMIPSHPNSNAPPLMSSHNSDNPNPNYAYDFYPDSYNNDWTDVIGDRWKTDSGEAPPYIPLDSL